MKLNNINKKKINGNVIVLPTFRIYSMSEESISLKQSWVSNFVLRRGLLNQIRFLSLLSKFHKDGKKLRAEKSLFNILLIVKLKYRRLYLFQLFSFIFDILEPTFFLRKFRKSGKLFLIPTPASPKKRSKLAIEFLFSSINLKNRNFKNNFFFELFADELISIVKLGNKSGAVLQKNLFINQVFSSRFSIRMLKVNVNQILI